MNTEKYALLITLLLIATSLSAPLKAEIYYCKDKQGRDVFSDAPCPPESVRGNTEAHRLWREMRTMVHKGQNITRVLGGDIESIKDCKRRVASYNQKLDGFDTRLNTLSKNTHKHLYLAQQDLRECGRCRTSAIEYCLSAMKELDKEMRVLQSPPLKTPS